MNKHFMIVATLLAFSAFGATNDVKHTALIYWTDTISYAQNVQINAIRSVTEKEHAESDSGQESSDSEQESSKQNTAIGGRSDTKMDASGSLRGLPTVKASVRAEAFAEARFDWERERIAKTRTTQSERKHSEKTKRDKTDLLKSDWKLRFNINFKNESEEQEFLYKEGYNYTGVFLVVKDMDDLKKDAKRIPVLPDDLKPDSFVLRPNGGKATLSVEANIPNEDIRQVLMNADIHGALDQCVTIEFDDQFKMEAKDTNMLWNYRDVCASKVAVLGFGEGAPEMVDSWGATYRQVLDKAGKLSFAYTNDGALYMVGKRPFGRFASDDKGVYVILAKIQGVFKDQLLKEDLDQRLSTKDDDKDLIFERLGLQDIYINYTRYPATVVSNCFSYVKNSRCISDEDLFACAMLAKKIRDYDLFGLCLTRMDIKKLDKILGDEENKSLAMSLIIELDNAEYLAKLYSLGWACTDRTILGFAAEKGATNIVSWLLEMAPETERPRPKVDGLVVGAQEDDVEKGKTPLYLAAMNGHLDVCRYLVAKGADINRKFYVPGEGPGNKKEEDVLTKGSCVPDVRIQNFIKAQREVLEKRNFRWRPRKPNVPVEEMRRWVDYDVLPDSYLGFHWNLLSWAIELKDVALVKALIDKGADVNGKYSSTPNEKRTALMLACEVGDTNLVAKLMGKGANLYAHQDDGMSAFNYAIKSKKYDCAEMLLGNLDVDKCSQVEDDDKKLNLFEYVGKYCDNKKFCEKVKAKDGTAWLKMLVSLYRTGFRECLDRCALNQSEAKKLLLACPTVQMADDLYDRDFLHGDLKEMSDDKKESSEAIDPLWADIFKFIELRKKADGEDGDAQNELGERYARGLGVDKDVHKAFHWFSKAAERGCHSAYKNLADCYYHGKGVTKNRDKADEYNKKYKEARCEH